MTHDSGLICETVHLGDGRSYPVLIGPGASRELAGVVPPSARKAAIVTQENIGLEVDPGIEHRVFHVPDGERAKTLTEFESLVRGFAQWGMNRNDVVIAVGGGVVTDLGGFAAASYHRGIPVVHVSTTLLGQIDASIGGKCGVNLPEGKNLVGAFWQPSAVLCDTDLFATLPPRDYRAGLGEMAKYHFLGGTSLGEQGTIAHHCLRGRTFESMTLVERVAASVRIKADVVAADEREGGLRAILNYGHTLAHALETAAGYDLRHGEAVAIGLVYAGELARLLGRIDDDRLAQHRVVVSGYDLVTTVPDDADHDELIALFARDKKALDGVTFVLDGPNGVEPVVIDDPDLLLTALDRMRQ
ncbi:MAG: 3-dehydroquinate synthase family protein [Acidimicrobiales bacterium]